MLNRSASLTTPSARARRQAVPAGALAILLAAFALRVLGLADQSFWWDEAYSAMTASGSLRAIFATLAREDFHPPLHYILLHFWMAVAGRSEFSLRFVSVAFGALTVAAAWNAACRLLGRSAAPIGALITALSPFLVYYAQEARMFAPVPFFGLLTLSFCAQAVERGTWRSWIGYIAAVTLGAYDFYYAVFMPFACGLWILAYPRGSRRANVLAWAVATAAAFLLYLPWLPVLVFRTSVWSTAFLPDNGPAKVLTWTWPELMLGLPNLDLYHQPFPAILLGGSVLITLLGFVLAWRSRQSTPGLLLAAIAFAIPFATIAAISAVKPIFHPRYAVPVAPGLYLLLAGVLDRLQRWRAGRLPALATLALLTVSIGYGQIHLRGDPAYQRDDYRDAIGYVQAHEAARDTIIHNAIPPFWYYYHGPAAASYFPTGPYTEANIANGLDQLTRGHPRLWYIQHQAIPNDPSGFIESQLRLHARLLDERWFGAIRVQLWQIPGDDAFSPTRFIPTSWNIADQLTLTGYAVDGEITGGRTVNVELRWHVQRTPAADDGIWVELQDESGRGWGRADTRPRDASYRPSSGWTPGEEVITRLDLPIAIGTPPGRYVLAAGVYRLSDLAGLDVLDADLHPIGQTVRLGTVVLTRTSVGTTDPSLDQIGIAVRPGLTLAAARLSTTVAGPGDSIQVTLLWRGNGSLPSIDETLALQSENGHTITRDQRSVGDQYPPPLWPPGALVREQHTLRLPADAPAGPAQVLLSVAGGQPLSLGTVTINRVVRDFARPSLPHPLQARFGDVIALDGYDISATDAHPGDRLVITLAWKSLRPTTTSYHVFVHLLDRQNRIRAQWDGVPRDWSYPTTAWMPGEYILDHYSLTLPETLSSGVLIPEIGLYDARSGQRLPVTTTEGQPDDRLLLPAIRITAR
ncbi:MAG TPA: glycosyltransferase family 39 protein [Chloroflexota bacterium]|nr:glycosyltransferase family 39 protein [Chloroflexota bacterium]